MIPPQPSAATHTRPTLRRRIIGNSNLKCQKPPHRHIGTQTPAPQRCPAAHCAELVHVQNPSMQLPPGPHWALVMQVPQVPSTHACPPPHWLLAVQWVQTPSTQARPGSTRGPFAPGLQSSNVEHPPHLPSM